MSIYPLFKLLSRYSKRTKIRHALFLPIVLQICVLIILGIKFFPFKDLLLFLAIIFLILSISIDLLLLGWILTPVKCFTQVLKKVLPLSQSKLPIEQHELKNHESDNNKDIEELNAIICRLQAENLELYRKYQEKHFEFHDMANNVPGIVYQWYERKNGERGFYYINSRCEDLYHIKAEDWQKDWTLVKVHPDDGVAWRRSLKHAVETLEDWSFEGRFILPNGEVKWCRSIARPTPVSAEEIVFNGIIIDTTHEKRLEESWQLAQFSLDNASDGVEWLNPEGHFIYINPAYCHMLGYSQEELLAMSVLDVDPNIPLPVWKKTWKLVQTRRNLTFESLHRHKDGSIFPVEIVANYLQFAGKEYICAFARDITERKRVEKELLKQNEALQAQNEELEILGEKLAEAERKKFTRALQESEQRFDVIAETVPIGILVVQMEEGTILYANRQAALTLGYPIDVLLEMDMATLYLEPEDRQRCIDLMEHDGYVRNYEVRYLRADHQEIWVEMSSQPIHFNNEDAVLAAIYDITDRKYAETQHIHFTKELSKLNAAYERFIPHEFLKLLEKRDIVETQLGDQVEKEMTVMFSDIRGFTSISENMQPQEVFDFVNAYLGYMEPVIIEHRGLIDKYIGDAIMALFPHNADDAVKGSIAMLKTLTEYNSILSTAGYPSIKIGIGLNTGTAILGIVGGQNRMDSTVISDAVNVASRVEGLTKLYGVSLLITEKTYRKLQYPNYYHIRVIDSVTVKGKLEKVTVYEVFDADPPDIAELKNKTLLYFEEGVNLFHSEDVKQAKRCFEKVLAINESDRVAQKYLKRCKTP